MARGLDEAVFWDATIPEVTAVMKTATEIEHRAPALLVDEIRRNNPHLKPRWRGNVETVLRSWGVSTPQSHLHEEQVVRLAAFARGEILPGEAN